MKNSFEANGMEQKKAAKVMEQIPVSGELNDDDLDSVTGGGSGGGGKKVSSNGLCDSFRYQGMNAEETRKQGTKPRCQICSYRIGRVTNPCCGLMC